MASQAAEALEPGRDDRISELTWQWLNVAPTHLDTVEGECLGVPPWHLAAWRFLSPLDRDTANAVIYQAMHCGSQSLQMWIEDWCYHVEGMCSPMDWVVTECNLQSYSKSEWRHARFADTMARARSRTSEVDTSEWSRLLPVLASESARWVSENYSGPKPGIACVAGAGAIKAPKKDAVTQLPEQYHGFWASCWIDFGPEGLNPEALRPAPLMDELTAAVLRRTQSEDWAGGRSEDREAVKTIVRVSREARRREQILEDMRRQESFDELDL
jgi:hypothetical protein